MTELRKDWSIHSPEWAYNQPGWKPLCARCLKRKGDCKKYNSTELGVFVGEWVCEGCKKDTDTPTPAQKVLDK